ncbi:MULTISPECIES: nitroreductase family protein [Acinetobacter]|uniref:nitroreductase family protein n=1 Tax=Acinetobacter TaxID=469 RepID=UPI0018A26423|nr:MULTISPECIES: nitroreductase family protein [Acinetobacter]MBF7690993.1 nitroreductase family protein [Acinetobacter pollinis]MBF7692499.1 nitroreductase family protein [Acinetobacter pollinis]MBF7697490.1 nitroreductase family protein [Acinetobacter pollinis]MBF7699685.1 nitroreductase family protein [Acinetobacter pollinis]WEV48159.1 nitroreductase family protein [Acinetobacter sp. ESL0695]
MSFIQEIEKRRTIYAIGSNVQHSNEELEVLIKKAIRLSPSAFNSQSSRAVILFDDSHKKFWEIVRETLRQIVPESAFEGTNNKISSFAAGKGTVLFYEDQDIVKGLQEQFAAYADNFPIWSEHSSAIAQFAVWTALSEVNVGASLQHYNPIADAETAKAFGVPETWKLRAQLVFGSIEAPAGEKEFMEDDARFKTFK